MPQVSNQSAVNVYNEKTISEAFISVGRLKHCGSLAERATISTVPKPTRKCSLFGWCILCPALF